MGDIEQYNNIPKAHNRSRLPEYTGTLSLPLAANAWIIIIIMFQSYNTPLSLNKN